MEEALDLSFDRLLMMMMMMMITQPSSSAVSHALISGTLSVLSSKSGVNNYTIKYSSCYFTILLKFTDVCVYGGTAEILCTINLGITYTTSHILAWKRTTYLR